MNEILKYLVWSNMGWQIWITWWVIFCIWYSRLFSVHHKKTYAVTDNLPIRVYVNKIENRITFKIKTEYNLELWTPEIMKQLLWSNNNKIAKDENDENGPRLDIAEVVLLHCSIVNNEYQQNSRVLYIFIPNK